MGKKNEKGMKRLTEFLFLERVKIIVDYVRLIITKA